MSSILVIGNALIDTLLEVDYYPHEDEELRVLNRTQSIGGNAANSMQVLQQLRHECHWVGTLAQDNEGQWLKAQLISKGVNISYAQVIPHAQTPQSTIIANRATGTRTILHYRDLPELNSSALDTLPLSTYDWFHLEGRNSEVLPHFIEKIKSQRIDQPISLELEKNRVGLESLISEVEVVFISQAYIKAKYPELEPEAVLHLLHQQAPQTIMTLTLGSQGAMAIDSNEVIYVEPAQVVAVVDSVGAGDVFNAGMISGLASGQSLPEALHFAVLLAERKVQQYGLAHLIKH